MRGDDSRSDEEGERRRHEGHTHSMKGTDGSFIVSLVGCCPWRVD